MPLKCLSFVLASFKLYNWTRNLMRKVTLCSNNLLPRSPYSSSSFLSKTIYSTAIVLSSVITNLKINHKYASLNNFSLFYFRSPAYCRFEEMREYHFSSVSSQLCECSCNVFKKMKLLTNFHYSFEPREIKLLKITEISNTYCNLENTRTKNCNYGPSYSYVKKIELCPCD